MFRRQGTLKLATAADITIVTDFDTGASRPYDPATDPDGMVFSILKIDGVTVETGGVTGDPPMEIPNIGDRVRFTGTHQYKAEWEEEVTTVVIPGGTFGGLSQFDRAGTIKWNFPEKAQLNRNPTQIDVSARKKDSNP